MNELIKKSIIDTIEITLNPDGSFRGGQQISLEYSEFNGVEIEGTRRHLSPVSAAQDELKILMSDASAAIAAQNLALLAENERLKTVPNQSAPPEPTVSAGVPLQKILLSINARGLLPIFDDWLDLDPVRKIMLQTSTSVSRDSEFVASFAYFAGLDAAAVDAIFSG